MQIERKTGYAPKSTSIHQQLVEIQGPCVGCKECRGLCHELLETLYLPELLLKKA